MRCTHCGTDSNLRDRTAAGGRCPKCSHRFAFEPTQDANKVTDGQFQQAVQRVSAEGTLAFTERQLWYEFNRKWMRPGFWRAPYGWLPPAGLGSGALLSVLALKAALLLPLAAVGGGVGLVAGLALSSRANRRQPLAARPPKVPFDLFRCTYLAKWTEVNGSVQGLVPPHAPGGAPPRAVPGDVAAFSFDRAVVTDHWDTAAMLVANRFHFEHNCAVLSRDGYPEGIAETIKEMLRRNPQLTVFALHDASPDGCLLPLALREPGWFPDPETRVVDVGLRPSTARRLKLSALPGAGFTLPGQLGEVLPAEDLAWLAVGNTAEVEALRPAAVMKALLNAFSAVGLPGDPDYAYAGDGGTIIWVGDMTPGGYRDTASTDGFG